VFSQKINSTQYQVIFDCVFLLLTSFCVNKFNFTFFQTVRIKHQPKVTISAINPPSLIIKKLKKRKWNLQSTDFQQLKIHNG